jgi:hypothetical protein
MATTGYTDLDDFLPYVLPYVQGCPSQMVKLHVLSAAIVLCRKGLVLKKNPATITMSEDINDYTLKYSNDRYTVASIDNAKLVDSDDRIRYSLGETSRRELENWSISWEREKSVRPTHCYLMEQPNHLRIYPTPSQDPSYDLHLVTRVYPVRTAVEVDEQLFVKWVEIIAAGAKSTLLLVAGASWADPKLGQAFRGEFTRGLQQARKTTLSGTGEHPGTVKPRSFIVQGGSQAMRGSNYDY